MGNNSELMEQPEPYRSLYESSSQDVLNERQRLRSEIREKLLTLKPRYDKVWDASREVRDILQELCKRDERFSFINSALAEFIDGQNGLGHLTNVVDGILSVTGNSDDAAITDRISALTFTGVKRLISQDQIDMLHSWSVIREIIDSAIYELLNVFGFDITADQVPIETDVSTHLELLRDLYQKSQSLEPQPPKSPIVQSITGKSTDDAYSYLKTLDPTTAEVRVVEILPGTGKDPIECHLAIRKLYDDGIPEALSYVWGKDRSTTSILVDQKEFCVTTNLYRILQGLRRPDTTRSIWIDAICINQRDFQEKTHQIRLMRDIYFKAKSTTIWLSGNPPVEDPTKGQTPDGGVDTDQYDLAALVEDFRTYPMDGSWTVKQWALFAMLVRCVEKIRLNEWWERVWTLQEATLPPQAPTLVFCGRSFSLDALIAAVNFILKFHSLSNHIKDQYTEQRDLLGCEIRDAVCMISNHVPLILRLRRGLEQNERDSAYKTFMAVLLFTDTYKATDPKDKIFALESLLPRCTGKLINTDYNEGCGDVFKRATARTYNFRPNLYMLRLFHFLFESQMREGKESTGPSWVLDLTYSDAKFHKNRFTSDTAYGVTLDGFLPHDQAGDIQIEEIINKVWCCKCFATPTTLFCTGYRIDPISSIGEIPSVGDDDPFMDLVSFALIIYHVRQLVLRLPVPEHYHIHENSDAWLKLESWTRLFSLMRRNENVRQPKELFKTRNRALAGRYFFITKTGIVGIASVPGIKPGDFLSWVIGSPVYFILRNVTGQDGGADSVQKHRIVARAALDEKPEEITERIKSLPTCKFQIV